LDLLTERTHVNLLTKIEGEYLHVKTMSRRSRFLLIAMSTAFGTVALGLLIGMCYELYLVSIRHMQLENVLGTSIAYNKILGGFGILGMVLFFAFLLSAIADKKQDKPR
jgi:hypothetical protein